MNVFDGGGGDDGDGAGSDSVVLEEGLFLLNSGSVSSNSPTETVFGLHRHLYCRHHHQIIHHQHYCSTAPKYQDPGRNPDESNFQISVSPFFC